MKILNSIIKISGKTLNHALTGWLQIQQRRKPTECLLNNSTQGTSP